MCVFLVVLFRDPPANVCVCVFSWSFFFRDPKIVCFPCGLPLENPHKKGELQRKTHQDSLQVHRFFSKTGFLLASKPNALELQGLLNFYASLQLPKKGSPFLKGLEMQTLEFPMEIIKCSSGRSRPFTYLALTPVLELCVSTAGLCGRRLWRMNPIDVSESKGFGSGMS